jgi:hypothetical protein
VSLASADDSEEIIASVIRVGNKRAHVSPVRYGLRFYIPEKDIFHSNRREILKSYIALTGWTLQWRRNVSPVKCELGFHIPEDAILHSHRRENLKSYIFILLYTIQLEVSAMIKADRM